MIRRIAGVMSVALVALSAAGGLYLWERIRELDARIVRLQALASETSVESAGVTEARLTSAVAHVTPSVVSIVVIKEMPEYEIEYFRPFGGDDSGFRIPLLRREGETERRVGAGTGFFVTAEGHIVTNKHVVADEHATYRITLASGEERNGRVIYRDDEADIAILKVEGSGYPALTLGDSDSVRIGQSVFAVGNALGQYDNSVSVGIVSGLDRTVEAYGIDGIETLDGVIQTDAAINLGNSGGPLATLDGDIIGVNVAVARGSENIAFAIPSSVVKEALAKGI